MEQYCSTRSRGRGWKRARNGWSQAVVAGAGTGAGDTATLASGGVGGRDTDGTGTLSTAAPWLGPTIGGGGGIWPPMNALGPPTCSKYVTPAPGNPLPTLLSRACPGAALACASQRLGSAGGCPNEQRPPAATAVTITIAKARPPIAVMTATSEAADDAATAACASTAETAAPLAPAAIASNCRMPRARCVQRPCMRSSGWRASRAASSRVHPIRQIPCQRRAPFTAHELTQDRPLAQPRCAALRAGRQGLRKKREARPRARQRRATVPSLSRFVIQHAELEGRPQDASTAAEAREPRGRPRERARAHTRTTPGACRRAPPMPRAHLGSSRDVLTRV